MKKNKKKKLLVLASAFALVALIAGTFAWFTSQDNKKNHFDGQTATDDDIEVVETFEPPKEWEPGSEVNKDVAIANTGTYDTLVRVSLHEKLDLLLDPSVKYVDVSTELEGKTKTEVYLLPAVLPTGFTNATYDGSAPTITIAAGEYAGVYTLKVVETSEISGGNTTYKYRYFWEKGGEYYKARGIEKFERDVVGAAGKVKIKAGTPTIGYVSLEFGGTGSGIKDWITDPIYVPTFVDAGTNISNALGAVGDNKIQLSFNNLTKNPTTPDKWYFNSSDGYFYFTSVVTPGGNTTQILDAVTLLGDAGNEFSRLSYDLTVTGYGISAYKDAVDTWLSPSDPNINTALSNALKAIVPAK